MLIPRQHFLFLHYTYIRLFVTRTVIRNRRTDRERYNIYSDTEKYNRYQQKSIHTCIVCSISNEQFTGLLPNTTHSFKFIQHCIFYFTFSIITTKITNTHAKFFTSGGTFT